MSRARLTMCRGLPGSGKTTWSREQKGAVVVTKDDIRAELKKDWNYDVEKEVLRLRDFRICEGLSAGKHVISADCNLARKHKVRLEQLAQRYKAKFEKRDFDTDVEECIRRDSLRNEDSDHYPVGEKVIRDMYTQYLVPNQAVVASTPQDMGVQPYVRQEGLPDAILCDLDGTLSMFAEKGHRGPYDASRSDEDEVNQPVLACVRAMLVAGYKLVLLSGREEVYREPTRRFLFKLGLEEMPLFMRKTNDTRKDWVVKSELFDKHIRGRYNILFCLDDRNQVVDFYRSMGLVVFQVAPGQF